MSRLTTNPAYPGRDRDLTRFWQLYWGDLGMVEDPGVARAMIALGTIIPDMTSQPELARRASLNLSHCVKNSLSESWAVDLGKQPCRTGAELIQLSGGDGKQP